LSGAFFLKFYAGTFIMRNGPWCLQRVHLVTPNSNAHGPRARVTSESDAQSWARTTALPGLMEAQNAKPDYNGMELLPCSETFFPRAFLFFAQCPAPLAPSESGNLPPQNCEEMALDDFRKAPPQVGPSPRSRFEALTKRGPRTLLSEAGRPPPAKPVFFFFHESPGHRP